MVKNLKDLANRNNEFLKVKELIKKYYPEADGGMFFTRNIIGDQMANIFEGEFFTLDICYYRGYFELFGTNEKERKEIEKLYEELEKEVE